MSNKEKSYHIGIIISERIINLFQENLNDAIEYGYLEDAEDYRNGLDRLLDLQKNDAEVSTLEEYFALIEELEKLTLEDVSVCNGGKILMLNV